MRWERLFADLEAEAEAALRAELEAEVAELTRGLRGELRLVDRLRGAGGREVGVRLLGRARVEGEVRGVGADWVHLRRADGVDAVVRLAAVVELTGVGLASAAPGSEGVVEARSSIRAIFRRLSLDRMPVTVELVDGSAVTGTIDVVGADHLEVGVPDLGETARAGVARDRRILPTAAVAAVVERVS